VNILKSYAPDTIETLKTALAQIDKWEQEQSDPWFWEKIGRIPFAILDKLTPKLIQHYIGIALDEVGSYIQTGGKYLISEEKIFQSLAPYLLLNASEMTIEKIQNIPLSAMNQVANNIKENHTKLATLQGATTGIGGIFTLAIDIPLLLGISLKVLQEMSITYGFDPKVKEERIFIIKCLQYSNSDYVGKQAILKELAQTNTEQEAISKLQGWREVIYAYRDNYGWKKLLQMVPVIGMLFGALVNRYTIQDVAETGHMLYQKRRILAKLNVKDEETEGGIK
jgi:hypothetical protein